MEGVALRLRPDELGELVAEQLATAGAIAPGRRREIVGVDPRLNERWSTRRAHVNRSLPYAMPQHAAALSPSKRSRATIASPLRSQPR
jgi:hypothetical protein